MGTVLHPPARTQLPVEFAGEGSGVAELSWGQREIFDAMRRQQTTMPLPDISRLPPGTTLADVADWLRYIMGRHQAMRTRLEPKADGTPQQVLYGSGTITIDVVEAGDEDPNDVARRMIAWRDQYVENSYDFADEWPLWIAVITSNGVPTHRLITFCHIILDVAGGMALMADLAEREAGRPDQPITAIQPLEQARWQQSPAGQRHSEAVLRRWADVLRQLPARRFPPPVDRGEPRYRTLRFVSPATYLAVQIIRNRTGAASPQVILALYLIALARVTRVNPSFVRVAVNNRFRRELADSVSIITQYSPCLVDVAGISVDEAVARLSRRALTTMKNAYFDPWQLSELVERVGRERGEELDIHCYFNDRRLSREVEITPDNLPTPADVEAALARTSISSEALKRGSERLFAAIEEERESLRLTLQADTHHLSYEDMVACARELEDIAVRAARDASALTGVA